MFRNLVLIGTNYIDKNLNDMDLKGIRLGSIVFVCIGMERVALIEMGEN